jgi:hypothetical protein
MGKFRKKPVVIEAFHYDSDHMGRGIVTWINENGGQAEGPLYSQSNCIEIHTLEGVMCAMPGSWVIQGVAKEFYPCDPLIFIETYDPVQYDFVPAITNEFTLTDGTVIFDEAAEFTMEQIDKYRSLRRNNASVTDA